MKIKSLFSGALLTVALSVVAYGQVPQTNGIPVPELAEVLSTRLFGCGGRLMSGADLVVKGKKTGLYTVSQDGSMWYEETFRVSTVLLGAVDKKEIAVRFQNGCLGWYKM